ncbi:5-methylcytosine-specific restriction endonuclease system specificity protein McrC [Polaromonas sp.]|uniref:5-methylcytosine-specific restriction endonuclease system specificity protein McrC n=1 Tax=Polaromonas sp. TaxID=1869339 RepID=UPI00356B3A12
MLSAASTEAEPLDARGHVGRIPVRNLWLLMLYASDLFRQIGRGKVSVEENAADIPDLVAEILAHAVEERLYRNLSSGFRHREAELSRVRGRIDLLTTERHQLLARGKVACRFEELTINTPRNRYVLAALEVIAGVVQQPALSHRCRKLANALKRLGVSGIRPTRTEVSTDRFGRNDANDRFMVAAARLALDIALPTEDEGSEFLASPARDETWARHLYEKAVAGFYDVVLPSSGWQVYAEKPLSWQIAQKTTGIDAIFPSMRTDVVLDHVGDGRRVVIDTKFTSIVKKGRFRETSLNSGYVYQIYAYLFSQEGRGDVLADHASGLLLHPSIGEMIDETVFIQGHAIRFATVDLAAPAAEIRSQLLRMSKSTF